MKDRLHALVRNQLSLAAIGFALAFALGGCAGTSSGGGAAASQDASGGGAAAAGAPGGSPANGRRWMAKALASLGLSDEQKTQIREIMSATRKENATADPATRRANFKAAMAKIDGILTPDQRTKLDEMRKERQAGASPQS